MTNTCICNKCERKALAVPGKRHRRCPGTCPATLDSTGVHTLRVLPLLSKHAKLPKASRGTWEGPALASK